MKKPSRSLALLASALLAAPAAAQDGTKPATPSPEKMQEMMMAYMEAMTPVKQHAEMAKLAGTWTTEETMWSVPGAPPTKATGSATYTPILGGRYLEMTHKSNYGGMPFEGQGVIAYDKQAKQYIHTWIDNMSTSVMVSRGTEQEDGSVHYIGSTYDPLEKRDVTYRMVMVTDSPDQHTFTMFKKAADGQENKGMQIIYTRKK